VITSVLDLDFYSKKNRDYDEDECKFSKRFGKYIQSLNTFTVQSPSGGFQLYFEYDELVKTTVNETFRIDVRSEGSLVTLSVLALPLTANLTM